MPDFRSAFEHVLAGVLVLRSATMTEYIRANVPDIHVPEEMIRERSGVRDARAPDVGIEMAVRILRAVHPFCHGMHIMPGRLADRLPGMIRKAEVGA